MSCGRLPQVCATATPAAAQTPTGATQTEPSLHQDATCTHSTSEQGLSDQRVQALVQDRAGFIWFGANNGLNRVVAYRKDPTNPHSLSGNFVEVLYEDRSGTLWIGTQDRGLDRFDRRSGQVVHTGTLYSNALLLGHWALCSSSPQGRS